MLKRSLFLVLLTAMTAPLVMGNGYSLQFMESRMSLMAEDLEAHDMQRLIHYFCPAHIMSNISLMDTEFDFSDEAIDMAIRNWGFLYANAASQMDSLNRITEVLDFRIEEDAVYFDVILEDGSTATIYSYIDWETLCLYAAAG